MKAKHKSHSFGSYPSTVSAASDSYQTIAGIVQSEIKIQGSRFISILKSLKAIEEFEQWIIEIRKKYFDATHHCFAYRIGIDGSTFRSSDDGEPTGTAGRRILSSVEGHDITDVGLIVVRYFGGTKLGVGGLSRAYSNASEAVISHAEIVTKYLYANFFISFSSEFVSEIHRAIDQFDARILSQNYDDKFTYSVQIRQSKYSELAAHLNEVTNGSASINPAVNIP